MNAIAPIAFTSAYRQLRPSERVFVDAYVTNVENEAAKNNERISNALYRPISAETVEASRGMLERALVRAAIVERINEIAAGAELTVHRVIKELRAIAFSSVGDYMQVDEDGSPYFDFTKCTPEQLSAIQSIDTERGRDGQIKFKFKLHDKMAGIDKLMRYMGLLDTDNPHWRADNVRPVGSAALAGNVTDAQAAEKYARMIDE